MPRGDTGTRGKRSQKLCKTRWKITWPHQKLRRIRVCMHALEKAELSALFPLAFPFPYSIHIYLQLQQTWRSGPIFSFFPCIHTLSFNFGNKCEPLSGFWILDSGFRIEHSTTLGLQVPGTPGLQYPGSNFATDDIVCKLSDNRLPPILMCSKPFPSPTKIHSSQQHLDAHMCALKLFNGSRSKNSHFPAPSVKYDIMALK